MHRFMLVVVFAVAVSAIEKEEFLKHCSKILTMHHCCKDFPTVSQEVLNNLKECLQLPGIPSCARDICFSTKRGYGTPDGKIDKTKAEKEITSFLSSAPKIVAAVKEQCFNGGFEKIGPPDMCPAAKFNRCVELNMFVACSNWTDDGPCKNSKMEADNCVEFLKEK